MKIVTHFAHPPIPDRRFDWAAYDDDTYDVDCDQDGFFSHSAVGYGATEADAVADLLDQLEAVQEIWTDNKPAGGGSDEQR